MKYVGIILFLVCGCTGFSSRENILIGQVKRIHKETPIFCADYTDADISLGVMRNGSGSMSTDDRYLFVKTEDQAEKLQKALDTGKLVKLTYDEQRYKFCREEQEITKVEILN